MEVDWGDVPTWLGGTFAAIAAYGAVATMRSQRLQIEEQRQFLRTQTALLSLDHRERTHAQALKVSLKARLHSSGNYWCWLSTVENWSDGPISDVQVSFGTAAPQSARIDPGFPIPASTAARVGRWFRSWPEVDLDAHISIGPRGKGAFSSSLVLANKELQPGTAPILEFTDTNNLRWRLDHYGDLTDLGSADSDSTA
ncbi:hypothetical protein OG864_00040 [Streptomyces sp. NBC_00124]|uniref:hypothetical protein n=1 Tax=Streptomyces sp. NBC_00124 TaxID=2975662 RepID=UPI00224F6AF4|nr:hypothetical protein [Streptomyces sp. NBC_00124]MCX5357182.1 hypothetical protein [Streptomyces sp. NBC_00124]